MIAISYLTHSEATDAIEEHFGVTVTQLEPLGGEQDQNLKVLTANETFFAKVVRDPAPGSAEWHDAILTHLMHVEPTVPLPRLVATRTGELRAVLRRRGHVHVLRLMTWLPGETVASLRHRPTALVREWGEVAGQISRGLSSMEPPRHQVTHAWDIRRALTVVEAGLPSVTAANKVAEIRQLMSSFVAVEPHLEGLPRSVAHQDLNDANVLAARDGSRSLHLSGVVDVNDALYTYRVAEVAVATAYSMLNSGDPLDSATELVAGFHSVQPLTDEELGAVYPLAIARLCMNAVTWNQRVKQNGSKYGQDRMRNTWPTLALLTAVHPALAEARFRSACGLSSVRGRSYACDGFALHADETSRTLDADTLVEIDVSAGSELFDDVDPDDSAQVREALASALGDRTKVAGVTPHLSVSFLRAAQRGVGICEPTTVQLGVGLLVADGAEVRTPLPGRVRSSSTCPDQPALVIQHEHNGRTAYSCWWGLSETVEGGTELKSGAQIGVADPSSTTGMEPFVQVQIVAYDPALSGPPPRWIRPRDRAAWSQLSPDPRPLLGLSASSGARPLDSQRVQAIRDERIARSQRVYFLRPMNLVRGRGVWLYDEDGFGYLDALNNVTHLGHAEPRVVAAAHRQMKRLNTNSRFLYEQIATYADRLASTLPDPLEVVFLVCSGSEANDLALRIARQVTGRDDVINIDGAYHGNTEAVTGISPNRYKGPGGHGPPPTTHEVLIPDRYRGPYGYDDADAGLRYAADVRRRVTELVAAGRPPAAFVAESLMGSAGNIVLPRGYLEEAFSATRAAGALCICDEVQVGVGRLGPFWGFELQGVVPDIVTMGKPLGNGHPLAALVTTREVANAFDTGMKYFNTFGGNPVSCAVGETVLRIVQEDGLQEHARIVGSSFLKTLREIQDRHELIGDVRGQGLYLGVELVRDRSTKEPATAETFQAAELMKDRGVLVYPNGVYDNVLKVKPPMVFDQGHVDLFADALDDVLSVLS